MLPKLAHVLLAGLPVLHIATAQVPDIKANLSIGVVSPSLPSPYTSPLTPPSDHLPRLHPPRRLRPPYVSPPLPPTI